ncbi:isoaspartyl peptidase/L-asparaginase family protein [uncultured Sphingomonas sp.]|uniref:isoaspartyl peptidase/L-asparaginase family protein n=1 Tax=uncultured Sphingomonas sp. TaxID=158754 RepID=UPI0035CA657A
MTTTDDQWTLLIHGGAGVIERAAMTPEREASTRAALAAALEAGAAVLRSGGAALDAVEASVRALEDDPHFNAGHGAALTGDGRVALDAAIMEGTGRGAGAVCGVSRTRHPVTLARAVMERSPHVFLAAPGADAFSLAYGLEQAASDWFVTSERRANLAELLARDPDEYDAEMKYGTVGAVARDRHGRLAAATSTGGVTGKRWDRIGDTPVIGSGTWADDRAGAISCTGSGEQFLRTNAAGAIAARMRLAGEDPATAAAAVLAEVTGLGGTGGAIVVAPDGEGAWAFTTPGMYRARISSTTGPEVALYRD